MKDSTVMKTHIVSKSEVTDTGGRRYAVIEIACGQLDYQPGQYVMIGREGDYFQWSYPHLILKKTANGIKVVVSSDAKLYLAREGDALRMWGANGKGVDLENAILVAEPATYFLAAPLAAAMKTCPLIAVGGSIAPIDGESITVTEATDPQSVPALLADAKGPVIMALNLPVLQEVMKDAPSQLKGNTTIFASVEIGCGENACKGCYLHSPDIRVGFPVCCEGPYLAYNQIDFETDSRCFRLFV